MFDTGPSPTRVALQQSEPYSEALQRLDTYVEWIEFDGGRALMQARLTPWMRWVGLISRGPVWDGAPDYAAFADALRGLRHPVFVNVEQGQAGELRKAGFLQLLTPPTIAMLPLMGEEGAQLGLTHQKWRNRWRKGRSSRIKLHNMAMPMDPTHWLMLAEHSQRKEKGYNGLPPELALAYAQERRRDAQLFTAERNGEPLAGMLFLRHGAMATYFMGHTSDEGRAVAAHHQIILRACAHFAAAGVETLDLGTVDTQNAPGLARFKLGTGAKAMQLGGTWLFQRHLSKLARWI